MKTSEVRKKIIHLGDKLVELKKARYINGFDYKKWYSCYLKIRTEILYLYEQIEDKENLSNDRKIKNVIKECVNVPRFDKENDLM